MTAAGGKRRNLGRGLSALLGEDTGDYAQLDKLRVFRMVPIEHLHPNRFQPRHTMDPGAIDELAKSIGEKGVLQPLLVRRRSDDANAFEIIAGERRWRAAQQAQVHEVPVVIKDITDFEALEIALVENLQRQDLSPLDEARGYSRLMEEFSHTQQNLAKAMGKSRSHVTNMMRLLELPGPVKVLLEDGKLTAGHARALLKADDVIELAERVVRQGLNVRQTEALARRGAAAGKKGGRKRAPRKDADTRVLERDMENLLGLKVDIQFHGRGGSLTIRYKSLEQLDDILQRLSQSPVPVVAADETPPAEPAAS